MKINPGLSAGVTGSASEDGTIGSPRTGTEKRSKTTGVTAFQNKNPGLKSRDFRAIGHAFNCTRV